MTLKRLTLWEKLRLQRKLVKPPTTMDKINKEENKSKKKGNK